MKAGYTLFLLLAGCGIHVTSDPVKVNHNVNINFEQILLYCDNICVNSPVPSCVDDCYQHYIQLILGGVK